MPHIMSWHFPALSSGMAVDKHENLVVGSLSDAGQVELSLFFRNERGGARAAIIGVERCRLLNTLRTSPGSSYLFVDITHKPEVDTVQEGGGRLCAYSS